MLCVVASSAGMAQFPSISPWRFQNFKQRTSGPQSTPLCACLHFFHPSKHRVYSIHMASKSKQKGPSQSTDYQPQTLTIADSNDDDDFMDFPAKRRGGCLEHMKMKPPTSIVRSSKRSKGSTSAILRHNVDSETLSLIESSPPPSAPEGKRVCLILNDTPNQDHDQGQGYRSDDAACGLDSIESSIDCSYSQRGTNSCNSEIEQESKLKSKLNASDSYNSMDSRLLTSIVRFGPNISGNCGSLDEDGCEEFEPGTPLDVLLKLCSEVDEQDNEHSTGTDFLRHQDCGHDDGHVHCPLCGVDISDMTDELRQVHSNQCLDKDEPPHALLNGGAGPQCPGQILDGSPVRSPRQIVDVYPVLEWLRSLGLARYEEVFVQEEIDWNALQWLNDEDLFSMGVTALGPRKKIIHALNELRKEGVSVTEKHTDAPKVIDYDTCKLASNKLITDYFPGFSVDRKKGCVSSGRQSKIETTASGSSRKQVAGKKKFTDRKFKDIPLWCCIPGTPFRVDAFKFLRRDCTHWFLTHFHMDHYQGLTKSFCHGKIYCSLITAKLVNMKLGITWDKLQVLPLNQKTSISGIDVTFFDANHCPGSIMILFEPPNGKAVLHTGDFRFSEEMTNMSILPACPIQTLILDTTYCMPQYDFPKQEAVIQFVIEAIQAEAFNPKTLFLIGSYTIGKERLFLEVARVLRKKVYVTAAKLRLLECLELSKEDMQWLTLNEQESHIHVVPMWTLASFKRLKYLSNQYASRFSLIVAFSPTGWSFGKGKKKSPGRKWQQGTVIRYEVPYSEHSSYTELKEFVKFISPANIIPSVNNYGTESSNRMVSLLLS